MYCMYVLLYVAGVLTSSDLFYLPSTHYPWDISSVPTTSPNHSYADDTQHTCHLKSPDISILASLHSCLDAIKHWLSNTFFFKNLL